jgi:hypothetical protein
MEPVGDTAFLEIGGLLWPVGICQAWSSKSASVP